MVKVLGEPITGMTIIDTYFTCCHGNTPLLVFNHFVVTHSKSITPFSLNFIQFSFCCINYIGDDCDIITNHKVGNVSVTTSRS